MSNQRLRHDQQDPLRAFRAALSDNQAGLDCFSQLDFVRENAYRLAEAINDLAVLAPSTSSALSPDGAPRDGRAHYHPGWVSHRVEYEERR